MNSTISWENKLLSFGVPLSLAQYMSVDLARLPYDPSQFSSIQELIPVMESYNLQSMDWWADLQTWLQELMAILMQITPGIVLTTIGGAMMYFLRNVKVKKVPMSLIGLIPLGVGVWIIAAPFLEQK